MRWEPPRITTPSRVPFIQAAKVALATVAAWLVGTLLLRIELPVFAAIAALLVVQPSVNQSVGKAVERSIGVIAGVVLAFLLSLVFGANTWIILLGIVAAIFLAWALRLTQGSSTQIAVSAMLVLSIGATSPAYAVERIVETVIGAAIGVVVNVTIVPPVLVAPAARAVQELGSRIATALARLADTLRQPQTRADLDRLLTEVRELRGAGERAAAALEQADESLALNPRQRRVAAQLAGERALYDRIRPLVSRVLGMTRTVHDRWDPGLLDEPTVAAIATELERAAHDLRLLVRARLDEEPPLDTAALPVLTAPVSVATPHPQQWILIGALLEDLRRVREEIIGAED